MALTPAAPRHLPCAAQPIAELIPEDEDVSWLSRLAQDIADEVGTVAVLDAGAPGVGDMASVITLLTGCQESCILATPAFVSRASLGP